jgi:hypothetical protein
MNFGDLNLEEERDFLSDMVQRLIRSQGRETFGDSMDLDYAWDMLEEYVKWLQTH